MINTIQAAYGKWPSILPALGISQDHLHGKHCACPLCPDGGKDRFRFANTNGKGEWFCNQCGNGDGFDLIQKINNWDFKTTAKEVDKIVGDFKPTPLVKKKTPEQARNELNRIRKRCQPISQDIINYLNGRGINQETIDALSKDVSAVQGLEYWKSGNMTSRYSAMACKVKKMGKPITYHITYIDKSKKADVSSPRKIMTPTEKLTGACVELFEHEHVLGVAEGIETAMSAYQMFGVPTWATLNANNMEQFIIPAGVKTLWIFGDNDESLTGQRAAETLERKSRYQGFDVVRIIPTDTGCDWNDVLIKDLAESK